MSKPGQGGPAGTETEPLPGVPKKALSLEETGGTDVTAKAEPGSGSELRIFIMLIVALLIVSGGFWLAKATTDPTASSEYVALNRTAQRAAQDRDDASAELRKLESEISAREDAADAKVAALDGREKTVKASEDAITAKEAESAKKIAEKEAAVKKREEAVTGAEKKKAANTVGAGIWTVGVDIEPGNYRADANVSGDCYWAITVTGSNGSDIVSNGIPAGGRPSAVVSVGHDFELVRCGTWSKQ